jgi:hypothetical protein
MDLWAVIGSAWSSEEINYSESESLSKHLSHPGRPFELQICELCASAIELLVETYWGGSLEVHLSIPFPVNGLNRRFQTRHISLDDLLIH